MIIERKMDGSVLITEIVNSQLISKRYYFTPINEAKKQFKQHIKDIKINWCEFLAK